MTRERVDAMLKAYRFEVGRCGHLIAEMKALEREIERERNGMVETLAAPKPQQITDMPHGTQIGNPTEKFGLMLASGYETPELAEMRARVVEMSAEYEERADVVDHVSSWLAGLDERGRWVVEAQVIDSVTWRDLACRYRQRFGDDASKDTLKRIRDKAMQTIYRMAE